MRSRLASIPLLFLFTSACGGGGSDDGDDDPGTDAAPACSPIDGESLAPAGTILDATAAPDGELALALRDATGALILIRGTTSRTIAPTADEASLDLDASGHACVAYRVNSEQKTYVACEPDLAPIDTGLDPELAHPHLVHHRQICASAAGGCIATDTFTLFFQGGFSEAAAANGSAAEGWAPEDLFISSISSISDTTHVEGQGFACVRFGVNSMILGHHPFRGDLDDLVSWRSGNGDCRIAARGRELGLVFGSATSLMLARWDVPLNPQGPWPEPAAPTAIPADVFNATFDLAETATGYELAYAAPDGTLHLATFDGASWTEQPAPSATTFERPFLIRGGGARHLLVKTAEGIRHWRTCE